MIKDMKTDFHSGVTKLLEDLVLESDPVKFLERLGDFTGVIGDLRIKVTEKHLDPTELSLTQQISAITKIAERLKDIDDLRSL